MRLLRLICPYFRKAATTPLGRKEGGCVFRRFFSLQHDRSAEASRRSSPLAMCSRTRVACDAAVQLVLTRRTCTIRDTCAILAQAKYYAYIPRASESHLSAEGTDFDIILDTNNDVCVPLQSSRILSPELSIIDAHIDIVRRCIDIKGT